MERETGLEPATYSLEGCRSSQLSYSRNTLVARVGFEPTKAYTSGFTVRPRWPLGYLATYLMNISVKRFARNFNHKEAFFFRTLTEFHQHETANNGQLYVLYSFRSLRT